MNKKKTFTNIDSTPFPIYPNLPHDLLSKSTLEKPIPKPRLADLIFPEGFIRKQHGECPTCGHIVNHTLLISDLERKEFLISGMCKSCQDKVFHSLHEE